MPALVNPETCEGCEDCIEECPTEAISMKDGLAVVDPDECTDCEACMDACPNDSISMVD